MVTVNWVHQKENSVKDDHNKNRATPFFIYKNHDCTLEILSSETRFWGLQFYGTYFYGVLKENSIENVQ